MQFFFIIVCNYKFKKNGNLILVFKLINTKTTCDIILIFSQFFEKYEFFIADIKDVLGLSSIIVIFRNFKDNVSKNEYNKLLGIFNKMLSINSTSIDFNIFNKKLRKRYNIWKDIRKTNTNKYVCSILNEKSDSSIYDVFRKFNIQYYKNKIDYINKLIGYVSYDLDVPVSVRSKQLMDSIEYVKKHGLDLKLTPTNQKYLKGQTRKNYIFFDIPGVDIEKYLKDDYKIKTREDLLKLSDNFILNKVFIMVYYTTDLPKKYIRILNKVKKKFINQVKYSSNIFNKMKLYDYVHKMDAKFFNEFFINQIHVKNQSELDAFLEHGKVYILKPIPGAHGFGQKLFKNSRHILDYIKKFKMSDEDKRIYGINKIRTWILQEYLDRPMLLEGRKFHIRVNIMTLIRNKKKYFYFYNKYFIIPAKKKYTLNSLNKNIHDTHREGLSNEQLDHFTELFYKLPDDIKHKIQNKILSFLKKIKNFVKYDCYYESHNCFRFIGIDLMITADYQVKCIEINRKPGGFYHHDDDFWKGLLNLTVYGKDKTKDYIKL